MFLCEIKENLADVGLIIFLLIYVHAFFFSMAMRISYQNLLQRLVVSKTSVQTVSYMKFLNTVSITIMKWKVYINFSPAVSQERCNRHQVWTDCSS